MSVYHMYFWVLGPLELELDMVVNQHVGTVTQTQVPYKSSRYSKPLRHLSSSDWQKLFIHRFDLFSF